MLDYKGLKDPHLNLYWQYDGKPYLENNITKAFINSIDSLPLAKKIIVFKQIFSIELNSNSLTFEYFLQRKPNKEKVESFDKNRRFMFAFSPCGECYGFNGLDTKNEKALYDAIKKELSITISNKDILENEVEKAVKEYLEGERGDSIPDAWILIYDNDKPAYIIALENKLYKLDPNQINNHIEKSLLLLNNKPEVLYKKYSQIADTFKGIGEYNTDQFIEYLTILGYLNVNDFVLACSSYIEIRQRLIIPFGKDLLSKVYHGEIDNRSWNVVRCYLPYAYLREFNLIFDRDEIKISLAFGPTQFSGKKMLETIDDIRLNADHLRSLHQSFHLLYKRGRNIGASYINCPLSLTEYIHYWKKHIDLIKTYQPNEAILLYKKMLSDGLICEENYEKVKTQLTNKINPVLVVPEIVAEYSWTYDEVANLGIDVFAVCLKEKLEEALKAALLK